MKRVKLSVVIPAYNEGENLLLLIPKIKNVLSSIDENYEILVIDNHSKDDTEKNVRKYKADNVKLIQQQSRGFGGAIKTGFKYAQGEYVLTMDADFSHNPDFIKTLWKNKEKADVIIASRYVKGGSMEISLFRKFLSKMLNNTFSFLLSVPVKDASSNFRLYKREAIENLKVTGENFDVLPEIIIRAYSKGYKVLECPFHYNPRTKGDSKLRLLKFGITYLKTFMKLWKLRNSIESVDYDARAYYSKIPLQRYWHRRRYNIVMSFLESKKNILDAGCGTNKIIQDLKTAVGLDINKERLKWLEQFKDKKLLVQGSVTNLPFKNNSFDTVICSEVIEHVNERKKVFSELSRVLKKKGVLIIGTPDYDRFAWNVIEFIYAKLAPGAYAEEHINHYTYKTLKEILEKKNFSIEKTKYVLGSEMIMKARKIK